ncbi:multidrug transporter subunit MdtD [Myroides odoratimimus]|uniref:Drug:H+ antiporter-2 (14 Spanner) (DHA2) family drug resistance MFS transporter n=1 Tax=Myroides odoratimimus CIP 101113 TaxID=883154 RepID=A0AAV3F0J4_9FLAO|nr:multidrug transporter subunit MdtD [Myroides odoratimimus]EHO08833.1 drug:H+ antiporter-2 (14 Spanner) (DHA2) family drug resistance MFS transporter [Myroides odoratimimus CIP 101113]MDM1065570.1 multidrug transporter subunit MdtD [Myroides odoratimimus]MDM1468059.1 multidrug transporter subunit MdtD [Myroides odoratimimus]MDM1471349.1 multidrug transporter subunit MdtD [Myroides odoratimimus]MDM1481452.1 multidrug transporter subunit MdtD [Myroides odoratimimus]
MQAGVIKDERTRKYLPWLGALAIFMQALDATILNTGLPSIAKSLGESPLGMQSIIVSYTLTVALLIPLSGWLADRFGTKKIFILAVGLFTLGSVFCSMSATLDQLVLARIFQAVGGAMMVPVARLTLIYAYPKNQLLKVINFITIPGLIGPMLGPAVGGFLVEKLSWHWIFLINVPVGVIAVLFARKIIPNFTNTVGRFDLLGWVLFSGGLTTLTLVIEKWNSPTISSVQLITLFIVAMLMGVAYVFYARMTKEPLIKLSLFKITTLRLGLIGNLITRFGIGGMPLMIPLLLQVGYGYSAMYAGMMMIPQALSNLVSRNFVVPIVRRFGYRSTLITNTVLTGLLISCFFFITPTTPYWVIILLMIGNGAFNAIQFTSMNTISLADLDQDTSSEGNSLLSVTQQLAVSLGISLSAMVLMLFQNSQIAESGDKIGVFRYTFLVMGLITILSSLVFTNLSKDAGSSMSGARSYKKE